MNYTRVTYCLECTDGKCYVEAFVSIQAAYLPGFDPNGKNFCRDKGGTIIAFGAGMLSVDSGGQQLYGEVGLRLKSSEPMAATYNYFAPLGMQQVQLVAPVGGLSAGIAFFTRDKKNYLMPGMKIWPNSVLSFSQGATLRVMAISAYLAGPLLLPELSVVADPTTTVDTSGLQNQGWIDFTSWANGLLICRNGLSPVPPDTLVTAPPPPDKRPPWIAPNFTSPIDPTIQGTQPWYNEPTVTPKMPQPLMLPLPLKQMIDQGWPINTMPPRPFRPLATPFVPIGDPAIIPPMNPTAMPIVWVPFNPPNNYTPDPSPMP